MLLFAWLYSEDIWWTDMIWACVYNMQLANGSLGKLRKSVQSNCLGICSCSKNYKEPPVLYEKTVCTHPVTLLRVDSSIFDLEHI